MEVGFLEASASMCSCSLYLDSVLTLYFSGFDVAIKIRPREDELQEIGVEFESRWKEYFANKPDKPVVWMTGQTRRVLFVREKRENS